MQTNRDANVMYVDYRYFLVKSCVPPPIKNDGTHMENAWLNTTI